MSYSFDSSAYSIKFKEGNARIEVHQLAVSKISKANIPIPHFATLNSSLK
jgi:hypothetical protein